MSASGETERGRGAYQPSEVCAKCGWLVKDHPVMIPDADVYCGPPVPVSVPPHERTPV